MLFQCLCGFKPVFYSTHSDDEPLIATVFSISISLLGLGYTLNKGILFIILVIIVIPFQGLINKKTFMIVRCGVYIKVFIEPKLSGMKWENVIHKADDEFSKKYLKLDKFQVTKSIYKYGTFIFSLIAFMSYCYQEIEISINCISVSVVEFVIILLMILCIFVIYYLCYKNSNYNKIYCLYEEILNSYNQ